jgi:CheY-like chemotaxis protein
VRDITSNPVNATIATTTIAMAHSMHLNVVAEGVESESQLNFLRRRQCDTIQGYYFSRPIPAVEFAALIESGKTISAMGEAEPKPVLLLVDDEPDILHALQRVLRRDGYRILTATSAREGLELLSSHPVKVVVSDQRMPEMNGTEFLSRVKELHPATVRIMLTGCSDLKSLTDGINRGAIWKYLEKPWEERALRETLREAFRAAENRG